MWDVCPMTGWLEDGRSLPTKICGNPCPFVRESAGTIQELSEKTAPQTVEPFDSDQIGLEVYLADAVNFTTWFLMGCTVFR